MEVRRPPEPDYAKTETMYRYLLGRCNKEERRELESAYLRDGKVFDRLIELETSIVEAYGRGELSTEDRADIEKHLLAHRHKPRHKPKKS